MFSTGLVVQYSVMPNISLPPELEYTIINHLSGDTSALQSCALVSRSWSDFSQHTLFRNIQVHLDRYTKTAKLLDDLISLPHLRTLVRGLVVYEYIYDDDTPLRAHMHSLASLLPLLPKLTKIAFIGNSFAHAVVMVPNLLGNGRLVELEVTVHSAEMLHDVLGASGKMNIVRLILTGSVLYATQEDYRAARERLHLSLLTRERLHLPLLEYIRFGVRGVEQEFHGCLIHHFDLPNLKQCEIVLDSVEPFYCWQGLLRQGFLPLELFKLELTTYCVYELSLPEYRPLAALPLAGLPFKHMHANLIWSVDRDSVDTPRKFIMLWSSILRALCNSDATIHFTELTFSFIELRDIDELLESACHSLDDSLAHPMFSAVRSVRFENETEFFAEAVTNRIHRAFPQLTSRGVLRVV